MKDVNWALVGGIWLLNMLISFLNARSVGLAKAEVKAAGGLWQRLLLACGWIMSACGFTWCYLIVLVMGAYALDIHIPLDGNDIHVGLREAQVALQLGYLIIIPAVLSTGLVIMVDSWAQAYRQGGFVNYGLAAYNTYAQIHNTYEAIQGVGPALESVVSYFGSGGSSTKKKSSGDDDDDNGGAIAVVILVAMSLFMGVITTMAIVGHYTASAGHLDWADANNRAQRGA